MFAPDGVGPAATPLRARGPDLARYRGGVRSRVPQTPLRAIGEVSSDGLIELDDAGSVLAANRVARRLFGVALAPLPSRRLDHAFADRSGWIEILTRALRGEHVQGYRAELVPGARPRVPVQLALVPLREAPDRALHTVLVVVRDLSEQLASQQALADSEQRIRRAESLARTGSFVVDAAQRSVQWSHGVFDIFRTDPGRFDSTLDGHLALVHEDDREQVAGMLAQALAGQTPTGVDHRIITPQGEQRWVFVAVEPRFDADGAVLGLSGACQDITGRVATEQMLQRALQREQQVSEELRRLDAIKDEFLATVSHELRTPLTSIAGFAALLGERAPEQHLLVEPLERNAREMRDLIERLLDQARVESGRVLLEPQELPLAEALRSVLAGLPGVTRDRVVVDVPDDLAILMDPPAFGHIVSNLVTNAIKYGGDGVITVSAGVVDGSVVVAVSDRGPGIPLEYQPNLFDAFFRVPGTAGTARGSGFGLSIVRRYVHLHGGSVWCESAPGEGTVFRFSAPLASSAGR